MKITWFLFQIGFVLYFALNAFNVLLDPHSKSTQFSSDISNFMQSLKSRCECKWISFINIDEISIYSFKIIKYGFYVQFVSAVGVLVHPSFYLLMAIVFMLFEAVRLNFAALTLDTSLEHYEEVFKVISLFLSCFIFFFISRCCNRMCTNKSEISKDIISEKLNTKKINEKHLTRSKKFKK